MKIQVNIIKELPDGSAECELTMDKAGHKFLMQAGFTAVMETVVSERKRENDIQDPLRVSLDTHVYYLINDAQEDLKQIIQLQQILKTLP